MEHYGGRPNFNPEPSRGLSFTARDAFAYLAALPVTVLAAAFFYTFTLNIAYALLGIVLPLSLAHIGAFVWVAFATIAFFFGSKAVISTVCQALGARLKLALFNFSPWRSRR